MKTLLLKSALLPNGWADNVELKVNQEGQITAVKAGVDISDGVVVSGCSLPGIPNVHSHAHQRAMAGLAERAGFSDDNFRSWRTAMYACLENMQPRHLQAIATQLYLEMLKFGYTNVAEFQYLHHDPQGNAYADRAEMSLRVVAAAERAGIGITVLPVLYRYSNFGGCEPTAQQRRFINDANGYCAIVDRLKPVVARTAHAALGLAPHSLRAVTPELLRDVLQDSVLQDNHGNFPIHIHVAEQTFEVDSCVNWSGQRPVQWLLNNCLVDGNWCLVHATHMTDLEMTQLAASGAVAGLCPTTEANLGDGIFPAEAYLALGGRFGIGSDSQVCVNAVGELCCLEYGQRLMARRRNVLSTANKHSTGRALFDGALMGGAGVSGHKIGQLAKGFRADLVVLDTRHPRLLDRKDDTLLDSWIFACDENPIKDVWVGGIKVIADSRHIYEEQIATDFSSAMSELRS